MLKYERVVAEQRGGGENSTNEEQIRLFAYLVSNESV